MKANTEVDTVASVPEPSYLPPDPSVGELVTEIDRARHDTARTMAALLSKLDLKAMVREKTHEQMEHLRWDGRRMAADLRALREQTLDAVPEPVAASVTTIEQLVRRVPVRVRVAVVVVGWLLYRWRRHRRMTT